MSDLTITNPALPFLNAATPASPDQSAKSGGLEQARALAQEFESMLLLQVMRQMRQTMVSADDSGQEDAPIGDLSAMTDTIDGELSRYLSRAGGLGLSEFLTRTMARGAGASVPDLRSLTETPAEKRTGDFSATTPAETAAVPVAAAPAAPAGGQETGSPLAAAVTSPFGWRTDPIQHTRRFHGGVDLRAAYGQEVPAAAGGRVITARTQGAYGLTVVVAHPDGYQTRYAHLSSMDVAEGDTVAEGQAIGRTGRSGRATGPHLHVELTHNGQRLDPTTWLRSQPLKKVVARADLSEGGSSEPVTPIGD